MIGLIGALNAHPSRAKRFGLCQALRILLPRMTVQPRSRRPSLPARRAPARSKKKSAGSISARPAAVVLWEYDYRRRVLTALSGDVEMVTGFTPAELQQVQVWQDLIETDGQPALMAMIHAALKLRTSLDFETRFRKADGSLAWARVTGAWRTPETMAGILADITARRLQEQELNRAALEDEKRRMAQFLHDELGQLTVKILMDIDWIIERREKNGVATGGSRDAGTELVDLRQDAATLLSAIRGEARDLLPAIIQIGDLSAALEWLGAQFERKAGLRCGFDFRVEPRASPLPKEHLVALFRISQEAMTNVWRHARATQVEISLRHTSRGLHLRIADNGSGMDAAAAAACSQVGLRMMKQRAGMIGASLSINARPGDGVQVSVRLPPPPRPGAAVAPLCL
jgi:PAS domain S-box-containing protein